jgi:hypothetical protein
MKKISKIFLISFTLLTFSNNTSAGFFGDIFKDFFGDFKDPSKPNSSKVNSVRCMVEYTQLDLSTGLETVVKHTSQFTRNDLHFYMPILNVCYLSTQDFTDKMNTWLNENKNNIISNITTINCKSRRLYSNETRLLKIVENRWDKYKSCDDEFNANLIDWLESPKQRGYNVNKERLKRNYEEGFKNPWL